jgi:hypothetical protein
VRKHTDADEMIVTLEKISLFDAQCNFQTTMDWIMKRDGKWRVYLRTNKSQGHESPEIGM